MGWVGSRQDFGQVESRKYLILVSASEDPSPLILALFLASLYQPWVAQSCTSVEVTQIQVYLLGLVLHYLE